MKTNLWRHDQGCGTHSINRALGLITSVGEKETMTPMKREKE